MEINNRSLMVIGAILIGAGILFLAFNFIPGWSIELAWPVIFFVIAAGFYIPAFAFPSQRQWIASFFIPGSIMIALGLIFLYQTITGDWTSWAYAWLLILAGIGGGLALAGWYGQWGRGAVVTGLWMLLVNVALFALFGAIFGGPVLKVFSPALLTVAGLLLLLRAVRR